MRDSDYEQCPRCRREIYYNQIKKHEVYCNATPLPIELARTWQANPTWSEIDLVRSFGKERGTSADRAHLIQGMYELLGWSEDETKADMTRRGRERAKWNRKRLSYDDRSEVDWKLMKRCDCCEILIKRNEGDLCSQCAGDEPVIVRGLPDGRMLAWYMVSVVAGEKSRNRKKHNGKMARVTVRRYEQRLEGPVMI